MAWIDVGWRDAERAGLGAAMRIIERIVCVSFVEGYGLVRYTIIDKWVGLIKPMRF